MALGDRLRDSADWILDSPISLVILMLLSSGIGGLFFGILSLITLLSNNWFFCLLFGLFSFFSIKRFFGIVRIGRISGYSMVYGGLTAREFVWHKGGDKDGSVGHEGHAVGCERDEGSVGKIGAEIRSVYRESERLGEDAGDGLQSVEANSK